MNSYVVVRKKQGREKEVDIRPYVSGMSVEDGSMLLDVRMGQEGTARVDEVADAVFSSAGEKPRTVWVERTGLFIEDKGRRLTPLEYCTGRIE